MSDISIIYKMNRKYQSEIRLRFTLRFYTSISLLVIVDIEIPYWSLKFNLSCNWHLQDVWEVQPNLRLGFILVSHFQLQLTLRDQDGISMWMSVVTDIYKMDGKYQSDIRLRFTLRFHTSISLSVAADIERLRWNQIPYLDSIMYSQCQIQVE